MYISNVYMHYHVYVYDIDIYVYVYISEPIIRYIIEGEPGKGPYLTGPQPMISNLYTHTHMYIYICIHIHIHMHIYIRNDPYINITCIRIFFVAFVLT